MVTFLYYSYARSEDSSVAIFDHRLSFAIFIQRLRHLKVMLERGQGLACPVLQFRIVATLRIAFEQRDGVLVCADLHRVVLAREGFRVDITQLVQLAPGGVI